MANETKLEKRVAELEEKLSNLVDYLGELNLKAPASFDAFTPDTDIDDEESEDNSDKEENQSNTQEDDFNLI